MVDDKVLDVTAMTYRIRQSTGVFEILQNN
jgi:hypothetical protein